MVGEVRVRVWRGDYKCILICKQVDSDNIRPIMGRKACVGMTLIEYTDNDALHKPATGYAQVYAVEGALISKVAITEKYATLFCDGITELEGAYRIRLDDAVDPIQHAPRRVSVALRDRLKATLDDMVRDGIIEAVEKTYRVDQLDGRHHEERQQTSNLSRSEGSKSRDPARKLPVTDDRRYRDAAARSQGVHRP